MYAGVSRDYQRHIGIASLDRIVAFTTTEDIFNYISLPPEYLLEDSLCWIA